MTHQRPKSGISFGSRNAAMTSKRWRTGTLVETFGKQNTVLRTEGGCGSAEQRDWEPRWSALMPRNGSLPFILGISKLRIARSKVERSERNACVGQLSNTTE
jgi:hypothetical protein